MHRRTDPPGPAVAACPVNLDCPKVLRCMTNALTLDGQRRRSLFVNDAWPLGGDAANSYISRPWMAKLFGRRKGRRVDAPPAHSIALGDLTPRFRSWTVRPSAWRPQGFAAGEFVGDLRPLRPRPSSARASEGARFQDPSLGGLTLVAVIVFYIFSSSYISIVINII